MRLATSTKNAVLDAVALGLDARRPQLLTANAQDLVAAGASDRALYDRLVVDDAKVDAMVAAVQAVCAQADPVGVTLSELTRPDGLRVINRTSPFGTILIIYESRPDVTVEAAILAFKAGSKLLLKGGKEARHSNRVLVEVWHDALRQNNLTPEDHVKLLEFDRVATQEFLRKPTEPLDLIVPRGGERLIAFVKEHARCAVLVSGRGNNFCYVAPDADWEASKRVIINAKTDKISACNALDKVLLDKQLPNFAVRAADLCRQLQARGVSVLADAHVLAAATAQRVGDVKSLPGEEVWQEEFLAMRCVVGAASDQADAVASINRYSGGHSATIMTASEAAALDFMDGVDAAAVYHNASTRFTDGGEMGVGAELAISTDKLHHRGPLGLKQLVTNKYYVFGAGHVR